MEWIKNSMQYVFYDSMCTMSQFKINNEVIWKQVLHFTSFHIFELPSLITDKI